MKYSFHFKAVMTAVALLSSILLSDAADAPAFLEVGKQYNLLLNGEKLRFKVIEIATAGWVKIALTEDNQIAWINTNAIPAIAPYPPQQAR